MEPLIFVYIAILLLAALLSTRLMKIFKLPNVTGYIITGIIMGPFVFGLFFNNFTYDGIKESAIYHFVNDLGWVSTIALGFIAFSIGTSFKKSILTTVGKRVIIITILEAVGGSLFVFISLLIAHYVAPNQVSLELVLTLSAIASATAPAATLMVIKQYKAHGPLVNTLLPVVALDDAAALILFAILFQIANGIVGGEMSVYNMIGKPLIEISISLGIGVVLGFLISLLNKLFHSRNNKLVLCIFTVFISAGLYVLFKQQYMGSFELSSLLMCMVGGAIFTNFSKDSDRTLDLLDRFTSPIYMMFFVLSGASLDLSIFTKKETAGLILLVALIYIVFRVVGKYVGALSGAVISKCEPQVKKYLGFTLVPQAGVAIGLATNANKLFNEAGSYETASLVLAVVLTSTLVYELVGPLISKYALTKAGEITEENKQISNEISK